MDVDLKQVAREVRKSVSRRFLQPSGHPSGSLSATEIPDISLLQGCMGPYKLACPCRSRCALKGTRDSLYGVLRAGAVSSGGAQNLPRAQLAGRKHERYSWR